MIEALGYALLVWWLVSLVGDWLEAHREVREMKAREARKLVK